MMVMTLFVWYELDGMADQGMHACVCVLAETIVDAGRMIERYAIRNCTDLPMKFEHIPAPDCVRNTRRTECAISVYSGDVPK